MKACDRVSATLTRVQTDEQRDKLIRRFACALTGSFAGLTAVRESSGKCISAEDIAEVFESSEISARNFL